MQTGISRNSKLLGQKIVSKIRDGKTAQLQQLSEEQAIEKGANLLSEILLFIIASAIATFQYRRANRNKAVLDNEIKTLKSKIEQLECALKNKS